MTGEYEVAAGTYKSSTLGRMGKQRRAYTLGRYVSVEPQGQDRESLG